MRRIGRIGRAAALLLALTPWPVLAPAREVPDTIAQRALACTGCHGPQGQSRPEGYVPRLAGKPAGYLLAQLQAFRDGRRRHATMAALLQPLDDGMLAALADHFGEQAVPYPPPAASTLGPADAERARQLVTQGDASRRVPACAACHGRALTGVAPAVPGLLGLPADYLVAQLGAWRTGQRGAQAPDCMAEVARRLSPADLSLAARWLAAQPLPARSAPAESPPGAWPLECGRTAERRTAPPAPATGLVARGAYLATLGNCAGCHTAPGGAAMAGGRPIRTPYGVVHGGNLTPDPQTGIGRWSADDFHRAMHEGRAPDGRRLLPAFPYPSFTRLARADNDALFAWLRSLPPVVRPNRPHELRFPYGTALAMTAWQWLNFRPAPARAQAPAEGLARGEYLVTALGHCGECHAPRGRWSAPGRALTGGTLPGSAWTAPSLHPVEGRPTPAADTVALLRHGRHARGTASGPMAEVVLASTQHWQVADLQAAADYLHALPATPAPPVAAAADPAVLKAGERIYADRCADCHGADGRGAAGAYPPLAGNPTVTQRGVGNLLQLLKHGGFGPSTAGHPRPYGMPPADLPVADTAAVLTYIRQSWGQRAPGVTALDVQRGR
ncbi:c-type cytochrome [Piscinibacter sakaiensis]|uniref:Putative diheme cytochrome c-553 n=1 Tax=Piscinibacter sakaiensis TaxID=1547922 RepID=A0A0K8P1Y0_PISS1|nr:c-type cytochrome [Piscinibacter sakaiensis]GAP36170.1 putative diheme cytochrome c-553 [Piscinibacter sakaiensis]